MLRALAVLALLSGAARTAECAHSIAEIEGLVWQAARKEHDAELTLTGEQARRFLDYLNTKVGEPTDYKGDALVLALAQDHVTIFRGLGGCTLPGAVAMDINSFMSAYKAAVGESV